MTMLSGNVETSSGGEAKLSQREQQQQAQKERTLFCINIDQRTTEDILYELFLQVNSLLLRFESNVNDPTSIVDYNLTLTF